MFTLCRLTQRNSLQQGFRPVGLTFFKKRGCECLQREGVNQPVKRLVDMIQANWEVILEDIIKQNICHAVLIKSLNKPLAAHPALGITGGHTGACDSIP